MHVRSMGMTQQRNSKNNKILCEHGHNVSKRRVTKYCVWGGGRGHIGSCVSDWGNHFGGCGAFRAINTPSYWFAPTALSIMEVFRAIDSDTSYEWEDDEAPFTLILPYVPSCTGSSSSSSSRDNDVDLSSNLEISSDLEVIEPAVAAAVFFAKVGHQKLAAKASSSFNIFGDDNDVELLSD